MSVKYKDTDYLHVSARIQAMSVSMIGTETYEKLLDAYNINEAFKVLTDMGYGGISVENPYEFEKLIEADRAANYKFIGDYVKDYSVIDFFRIPIDYKNIKAVLKAEYMGISPDSMLSEGGKSSAEEMKEAVTKREGKALSDTALAAISESIKALEDFGDPQMIDLICDRACYKELLNLAVNSSGSFLVDYFRGKVDIINITSFLRCKKMKKDLSFFEKVYIPNVKGGFELDFFTSGYNNESLSDFGQKLMGTDYSEIGKLLDSSPTVTGQELDSVSRSFEDKMIEQFSYIPFGIEVVFSYMLKKEREYQNLRFILKGRMAGIDAHSIRSRLLG